ncbi:MAG: hypothetical protein ACU83P_05900 [Gammaproteobacteria bacterium]
MDKIADKKRTVESSPTNSLDDLCQEFDGISFYGLEYIVEDFFQSQKTNPPHSSFEDVDWFGLDD